MVKPEKVWMLRPEGLPGLCRAFCALIKQPGNYQQECLSMLSTQKLKNFTAVLLSSIVCLQTKIQIRRARCPFLIRNYSQQPVRLDEKKKNLRKVRLDLSEGKSVFLPAALKLHKYVISCLFNLYKNQGIKMLYDSLWETVTCQHFVSCGEGR